MRKKNSSTNGVVRAGQKAPAVPVASPTDEEPVETVLISAAALSESDPIGQTLKSVTGSNVRQFNNAILNSVAQTLYIPEDATTEQRSKRVIAALAAVCAFQPQDEVESMMAAQAVGAHHASMECLRRAMLPGMPHEMASRLRKDAANLMRTMVDMADALDRKRGKGPQVVRVERVVVNEGGQAVVGNVSPALSGHHGDAE